MINISFLLSNKLTSLVLIGIVSLFTQIASAGHATITFTTAGDGSYTGTNTDTSVAFSGTVGYSHDQFADNPQQVPGFLVGSSTLPTNDKPTDLNYVIEAYNQALNGDSTAGDFVFDDAGDPNLENPLPLATADGMLDKLDEEGYESGYFSPGEFKYYVEASMFEDINDTEMVGETVDWNGITLYEYKPANTDPQSLFGMDTLIAGFKYVGDDGKDENIEYVTGKFDSGNAGYSVWRYAPGELNVVYFDSDGDQSFDEDVYQFGGNSWGISHVSFYGSGGFVVEEFVPEPASLALMGLGSLLAGTGVMRRRKKQGLELNA